MSRYKQYTWQTQRTMSDHTLHIPTPRTWKLIDRRPPEPTKVRAVNNATKTDIFSRKRKRTITYEGEVTDLPEDK